MTPDRLDDILRIVEDYNLELKIAKEGFSVKKLHDYCAAISNEDGGHLLFGVDDDRNVVGSRAFKNGWNKLAHELSEHLGVRVKVYEVKHSLGRVLVFEVPRHASGIPIKVIGGSGKYTYPIRDGESLVEMDQRTLQDIFDERIEDWSAKYIKGATIDDLDESAMSLYREKWASHMRDSSRLNIPYRDMLMSHGLINGGDITNAALLLFSKEASLQRFIPDAEIIFEWRNEQTDIAYGDRRNWRSGFMRIYDDIWSTVDARNTAFRFQEGFTQRDIQAYDEESIREAVINAFVHRDYTIVGSSIVIMLSPENFYIENPGRLMPGVTPENIIDKRAWRNRLLAESLEKVNLMERSSQGVDKIFRRAIESGKGAPSILATPDPSVQLTIPARLVDEGFVKFLERIVNEKQQKLSIKEIIELESIRTGGPKKSLNYADKLADLGIVEKVGRGRGMKYILSRRYYEHANSQGKHARIVGLPRGVKRNIIMEYLKNNHKVTNADLQDAMPDATPAEISSLLKGMARDSMIKYEGKSPRWGYWRLCDEDDL